MEWSDIQKMTYLRNLVEDGVKVYDQGTDGVDIEIISFVEEICSLLNGQYIETACKNYNHLKYLKLADYQGDNEYLEVDILIGTVEQVLSNNSKVGLVHYLPHRPVIREDKVTTKMRMVFDASATNSGPSLNDCLYSGPSLTTLLYEVLIRFCVNKIAFIADIEKAFLNISISEKHRGFIQFLWYENVNNLDIKNLKNHKIVSYRLCRVLFGVTFSPFLLSATLISHAERYLSSDPIFLCRLNSIHVDDLSFCSDTLIEYFKFYEKCRSRLGEAGFNLRKFESNSVELDKLINETNFLSQNITKVLGLTWNKK
ncbi:uncharacterized protein LOC136091853 [Hydra vulgaris]|uniref:Uncharacterized protein LOC136091853 n=1 Tax=Hydra vulgaris TaxID=6087 RepID=A0ABM4DM53_HYDVU